MQIKEIGVDEFNAFAKGHVLGSFYQSSHYALVMAESGYDYDYIGFVDNKGVIHAATLILHKKIGLFYRYGYSPNGFLVDYHNKPLVRKFSEELIKYYKTKNFAFIKINPEIAIGEVIKNNGSYKIVYNENIKITKALETMGYNPLNKNLYFESLLPRFNAILPLKNFHINTICKETRNKVKKSLSKGFELEFMDRNGLDILYPFIKGKTKKSLTFYKDLYNVFIKEDLIDIVLVKINFEEFVKEAKEKYEKELGVSSKLLDIMAGKTCEKLVNLKMQSDKNLIAYKESMTLATKLSLESDKDLYVAGAIIIKHEDRIYILESGYDRKYVKYCSNYFLHEKIFEHYKKTHKFVDLGGLTGDFSKENPYYGLNHFKMGFKPISFEFIGEFDLVIKNTAYNQLIRTGLLYKEFNK